MLGELTLTCRIRCAEFSDLPQLVELEKVWPEDERASAEVLEHRIQKFQKGFLVIEDDSDLFASIISIPYYYDPNDLSNFKNWQHVVQKCYQPNSISHFTNALYLVSATHKPSNYGNQPFTKGLTYMINLAKSMELEYVIAGCILPGYAKYISKRGMISATDYVFKSLRGKLADPLLEKYRHLNFIVPDKNHVLADYYPHAASLNYAALVVHKIST